MYKLIITFADQGLVSGLRFIYSILLARLLNKEEFGIYVLLWAITQFVSGIHQNAVINPTLAQQKFEAVRKFDSTVKSLHKLFCILGLPLLSIVFFSITKDWSISISIALYSCVFLCSELIRRLIYISNNKTKLIVFDFSINVIPIFSVGLMTVYFDNNNLSTIIFLTVILSSFVFWSGFARLDQVNNWHEAKNALINIWNFCKDTILLGVLQFFAGHFFIFVLAQQLGATSTAEIGAARNLLGPLLVLYMAFDTYLSPLFSEKYKNNNLDSTTLFKWVMGSAGITLIIILPIFYFSEEICSLVYGENYTIAPMLVKYLSISYLFMAASRVTLIYLRINESGRAIRFSAFATFIFSLIFTIPMISVIGYHGAMIVVNIQQFIVLAAMLTKVLKPNSLPIKKIDC